MHCEGYLNPVRREAGMIPERTRRRAKNIRLKVVLPLIGIFLMSSAPFFSQDAEARPVMSLDLSLSHANLEPMEVFTCTVQFDNAGSSPASAIWINITLPDEIAYISDDAGQERGLRTDGTSWTFSSVSPGEHAFDIMMRVATSAADGDVLTIQGNLEYHDRFLAPMPLKSAVTLTVSAPTWNVGDPAIFDPVHPVDAVKVIVSSGSANSTNNIKIDSGHGDIGDKTNDNDGKDDPPLPPATGPGNILPEDIIPKPNDQTDNGKSPDDDPNAITVTPPTDRTVPTATVDTPMDRVDDGGHDSYVNHQVQEEPPQADTPTTTRTTPSSVSSDIISNNKVYGTGDVLSFTVFINNTGSQTAGQVRVRLTIPSSIQFVNDNAATLGGRFLGQDTYLFTDVEPGNHEFMLFFIFKGEAEESTDVEIWVHVSYTDGKGDFVGESTHRAVCSVVPGSEEFPLAQVAIVILSTGLMSVVAFSTGKLGKHSLLPFFVPLYSRLRRKEVLNHEARDMIIGYIKENPGEHFNSLKSKLDFRNGTLAHHLHILERERVIKSVKYGKYRRFFPVGMMVSKRAYPTELEQEILEVVGDRPGINQKAIARIVGKSKSTVNYHINKLRKTNKIRTEKNGLSLKHYVVESEEF